MARFNCNLPAPAARDNAQVSAAALEVMEREDAKTVDEASSGPGWFDSSRELTRGLEVTESAPGDSALNEWIRLCLAR
jgi:hypothetical protein